MPVINWWDAAHIQFLPGFNPVVTDTGIVLSKTPCPYTQDFWNRWIVPQVLGVVGAVSHYPLAAVLIDVEMYNAEYSGYYHGCYCDTCYKRYMQAKGISGPLPAPSARYNTVNNAGNLAFYQSLQRNVAASYSQSLRASAQTLRPGLRHWRAATGRQRWDQTAPTGNGPRVRYASVARILLFGGYLLNRLFTLYRLDKTIFLQSGR